MGKRRRTNDKQWPKIKVHSKLKIRSDSCAPEGFKTVHASPVCLFA